MSIENRSLNGSENTSGIAVCEMVRLVAPLPMAYDVECGATMTARLPSPCAAAGDENAAASSAVTTRVRVTDRSSLTGGG